jgi:hypothetical protein
VKGKRKEIKASACLNLIKTQTKYLNIALYFLGEEFARETVNKERVCCLCDYVAVINKIISFFSGLTNGVEGETLEITYAQAVVAKTYMLNFRLLKKILIENHNIFVEMN